jgi:hypothetical protein
MIYSSSLDPWWITRNLSGRYGARSCVSRLVLTFLQKRSRALSIPSQLILPIYKVPQNLQCGSFDVITKFFRIWNNLSNKLKSSAYYLISNITLYEKIQQEAVDPFVFNNIQQDLLQSFSDLIKRNHGSDYKDPTQTKIAPTYQDLQTRSNKSD